MYRLPDRRYSDEMLKSVLRTMFGRPAAPTAPHAVEAAAQEDLPGRLRAEFEAAAKAHAAGRPDVAARACRAILERDRDYSPAHHLLAAIEMPGEPYGALIDRIHAHLQPRTYLEIGVFRGASLRLVRPSTAAIGVDPLPKIDFPLPPNIRVVAKKSDDYFAEHDVRAELGGLPVELGFIDGLHQFEYALRDFINLERLSAAASTILIHDVYPLDANTAARERRTTFWSGDTWRVVLLLRRYRPDLVVHTVLAPPSGLAIVRNLDPGSTLLRDNLGALVAEGLQLDYDTLDTDKAGQLALLPNDWEAVRAILDAAPALGHPAIAS